MGWSHKPIGWGRVESRETVARSGGRASIRWQRSHEWRGAPTPPGGRVVGSWLDYVAGSGSRVERLEEGIELVAPARGEYAGGPKG